MSVGKNQFQAIDKSSFKILFETYYDRLLAFSYSYVRNQEEARDLVQESFIALWERTEELALDTNLYAYLLTLLKNKSLNYLRSKKLREQYAKENYDIQIKEIELQSASLGAFPIAKLVNNELKEQLRKAITTLPEQCQKVFEMRFYDQLKNAEIAEQLAISEKTVKNHLTKAIKMLQIKLGYSPLLLILYSITKELQK